MRFTESGRRLIEEQVRRELRRQKGQQGRWKIRCWSGPPSQDGSFPVTDWNEVDDETFCAAEMPVTVADDAGEVVVTHFEAYGVGTMWDPQPVVSAGQSLSVDV